MKQSEIAVTNDLFRLLVENVQDYGIFLLDPQGHIITWNAGAERIKGYTAQEIIGQHFSIFYPKEKVEEGFPQQELEAAARDGRFEDEGWRLRKDGSRFWANVVITALRDTSGKLVAFAKITRDLTERRRAEKALRESEERFRLLVQGVRDYSIFMLDADGRIVSWNDGAERTLGYTSQEAIGRHFSIFYPREDVTARKTERELEHAREFGTYEEEGWRVRKDGTKFWSSVLITALYNRAGKLMGFGKVTRDLTERRAAQEQSLEDARRIAAAESANKAKSTFLASMSHELRTPLNAIGGYADLMSMEIPGPITEQQREQLVRIRSSQQHLLSIINDILNYSRLEAGRLVYDVKPTCVDDVLQSVSSMIIPQARAKGIRFEPCEADPLLCFLGDRIKVEQVLLNLLSNAVKFTPSGGRVWMTCKVAENKAVEITVHDNGPGIESEQIEEIFEPFVQVGRSLTSTREGTGLGLAISRDLARAMGGDVLVETTPGVGSAFTVQLPPV